MNVLRSLHVNIPFTKALNKMPAYAKFLKEVLSKKRSILELIDDCNTLYVTNDCRTLEKNLLVKLSDPGRFTITIGLGSRRYKALCDLGASTSLLSLSI